MMLLPRVRWVAFVLPAFVVAALTACSGADRSASGRPPPRAEFLLGSADSTFWVATAAGGTKVRGAPLILARYEARLYEVYAHHEDLSYPDALLLGDRIYRRDLLTGDSAVVFADTTVPRMAREYAATHPNERPLLPNEDGEANPATAVTAEVDILDVYGPYLSYEYHLDLELPGKESWHTTRQGVLDLRSGKALLATDLFGADRGVRLAEDARREYAKLRDSVAKAKPLMSPDERRAAAALEQTRFDESSFRLLSIDGQLAVSFSIPGRGEGPAGNVVELEAIEVDSVPWWSQAATGMPTGDDSGNDRWRGAGYEVVARYDTSRSIARVSIADSAKHEWLIAGIHAPLFQIIWLDDPPMRDAERNALTRAFNHAASYDEGARVAVEHRRLPNVHFTSHAPYESGPRKSSGNIRAHDAPRCEQHGACLRRRDSVDDGQMRGDRRVSAQPRQRRHGIDRSRGVSRADPPRRSGGDEGECQFRGAYVDGSRGARRSGRSFDRSPAAYKLLLSDVRCR